LNTILNTNLNVTVKNNISNKSRNVKNNSGNRLFQSTSPSTKEIINANKNNDGIFNKNTVSIRDIRRSSIHKGTISWSKKTRRTSV